MLDALEKIQSTEEALAEKKQAVLEELKHYAQEKNDALERQKIENQQLLQRQIQELESQEKQRLAAEAQRLQQEAVKQTEVIEEQYANHRREAIQTIIKKVREQYGRH